MTSTAIIPFDSAGAGTAIAEVPEHLVALFGDSANITPRFSINQLSYRGKTWRRVVEGEETVLTRTNGEGDEEPIPIVNLVILDHNKSRSRAFYEGAFEEGKNSSPRCYSGDGVTPDASVKEPCAATCATCPNAVKGSKITENGKQSTLCSPFKRVAVVPSANIGAHPAMLLRLAQTSVWDKDNGENEAKGWYAWDQYLDMLRARGAKHTAVVETRVKFDMRMAYPKLLFSASRWMNPDEAAQIKQMLADKEKEIGDILLGSADRDGVSGHPAVAPADPAAAAAATAAAAVQKAAAPPATPAATKAPTPKPPPKPTPAATAAPVKLVRKMTAKAGEFSYEQLVGEGWDDESLINEGMMEMVADTTAAPKPPAKPSTPKPPKKAAAAPAGDDSGDAFAAAAPAAQAAAAPAPAPAAAAPAATVVTDTPAGLANLLQGWDDDGA